jgi:putative hydrolase of the HAD superfamily
VDRADAARTIAAMPETTPFDAVQFDAVLFDAGGVLVVPDPMVLGAALEPFGGSTSVATLIRSHYAGMRAQDAEATERDDWAVYAASYVRAAGVPEASRAEATAAMRTVFSPYLWRFPLMGSVAALVRLRNAGVPIGVVSNASGQIEACLANQGVCQVGPGAGVPVSVVVDSEVVGVMKPDPKIFAPALEVLGLPPERVAYVGDSVRNDVHGALAAGLQPLHLDPYDDHPDAAHRRIRSVADVAALLGC